MRVCILMGSPRKTGNTNALRLPFQRQQLPHFHHQRLSKSSRLPGYFSFSSVSRVDSVIIGACQRFVNCFFHKNK